MWISTVTCEDKVSKVYRKRHQWRFSRRKRICGWPKSFPNLYFSKKTSSAISNSFLSTSPTSTYCASATGVTPSEGGHQMTERAGTEKLHPLWLSSSKNSKAEERRGESEEAGSVLRKGVRVPFGLTHRCVLSTSACGRRRPGAVLQTPAPSDTLHGVAAKTRVHRHVPELEHRPPHHPIGHMEGGATGHPCTTAQMERPTSYILSACCP